MYTRLIRTPIYNGHFSLFQPLKARVLSLKLARLIRKPGLRTLNHVPLVSVLWDSTVVRSVIGRCQLQDHDPSIPYTRITKGLNRLLIAD